MHVQDGPDLDLSVQVARVKEKTRPWWSIISLALAIAAAITSAWAHGSFETYFLRAPLTKEPGGPEYQN